MGSSMVGLSKYFLKIEIVDGMQANFKSHMLRHILVERWPSELIVSILDDDSESIRNASSLCSVANT